LALAVLAAGDGAVSAEKLDKESCKSLSVERESLVAAGVKGDMDRGPEWAKANLNPERLGEIKRLMELGEQLEFRCGSGVSNSSKLAKKPDAEDGPGDKQPATTGTKQGKHSPAARSDISPEMKLPQAEGSAEQKVSAVPPPSPLALTAAPISVQSRSSLGAAKPVLPATAMKPVAPAPAPHRMAESETPPALKLPMPVKTITPEEAAAKVAPRVQEKPVAVTPPKSVLPETPPSLGKATMAKEGAEAPSLGKADHSESPAGAGPQDAASEDGAAPSLGNAVSPAGGAMTLQGLGTAAAPAAALAVPSLGKAGPQTAAGAKKSARRRTSNGYVAPVDVNPGFLTRYGSSP
jgi:hypothetical protein